MKDQKIPETDSFVRRLSLLKHGVARLFGGGQRRLWLAILVLAALLVGSGTFEAGDAHADIYGDLYGRFFGTANHSQKPFEIELRFNRYVVTKPKHIVGFRNAVRVRGGHITKAERLDVITEDGKQLSKKFLLTVKPMEIQSGRVPNVKLTLPRGGSCAKETVFCTKDGDSQIKKVTKTIRFKLPAADKLGPVKKLNAHGSSTAGYYVSWEAPESRKYLSGYDLYIGSGCTPGFRIMKVTPTHNKVSVWVGARGLGSYSVRAVGYYGKGPCKNTAD